MTDRSFDIPTFEIKRWNVTRKSVGMDLGLKVFRITAA